MEALNEARSEIRDLFIANENTHDIIPSPHRRSSTAAATLQFPTPYKLPYLFNYEYNPLPFRAFVDRISSSKKIKNTGEIFSRSSGNIDSLGDRNKAHAIQIAQAITQPISRILLKYNVM